MVMQGKVWGHWVQRDTAEFKDGFNMVLITGVTIKTLKGGLMSKNWQKAAVKVGRMIHDASKRYPQLSPLHSSWMNFARKYQVKQSDVTVLEANGMLIVSKDDFDKFTSTIKRQDEEIRALEYRIATLLRPEQ